MVAGGSLRGLPPQPAERRAGVRALLVLLGFMLSLIGGAQPAPAPQPPSQAQLLADFDLFRGIYEAANAGLYKYHLRRRIDSLFAAERRRITPATTLLDFYRLTCGITAFTGSLHSDNYLPADLEKQLKAEPAFFPYPLRVVQGRLLVNVSAGPLPAGTEVLRLDGRPAAAVLRDLGKYATTDGYNQTGKHYLIGQHFAEYYRWEYGPRAAFALTYRRPGAADTLQLRLPAVPYATAAAHFKRRHSAPLDTARRRRYHLALVDSARTAVLTVSTFDFGGTGTAGHRRYARFLDSAFQLLRRRPELAHLVVDLRRNGGGDDPNDLLLFSYLTAHRFRENRRAYVRFRQVPFPQYFAAEDSTERAELERELHEEHRPPRGGRCYLRRRETPVWRPNPLAYRGQVYLLTDAAVASAGALFASLVRSEGRAVIIGEETMGGYYGHTGHTAVEYELPHTHLRLKFSIVDLEQDVRADRRYPYGRGVLPDYPVSPSPEDFVQNRDAALSLARQLIRQRRAARQAVRPD